MSSQNWGESGFGLAISEMDNDLEEMLKKVAKDAGVPDEEADKFDGHNAAEFLNDHVCDTRYYDYEGSEGITFSPAVPGRGNYIEDEEILFVRAEKQPDAFKASYTEESVVREFREKVGKYLPENFDYLTHIGTFSCCTYN